MYSLSNSHSFFAYVVHGILPLQGRSSQYMPLRQYPILPRQDPIIPAELSMLLGQQEKVEWNKLVRAEIEARKVCAGSAKKITER